MRSGRSPAAILDALGDPVRRLIYERLTRYQINVSRLAKELPVTRSAVSRHLQVLKNAGLVAAEASGSSRIYRPCADGLDPLAAWIETKRSERPSAASPPVHFEGSAGTATRIEGRPAMMQFQKP